MAKWSTLPNRQQGEAEREWHDEEILAMQVSEGRKDDGGKAPHHLIAPEIQDALAAVLDFGARKYAPRNWEKGMAWSRPFSALMRHMWAWWRGEHCDPETGMSHLHHAACCLMFLVAYEARSVGLDDRPDMAQGGQGRVPDYTGAETAASPLGVIAEIVKEAGA